MTLLYKLNKVNPSLSAAESAEFAGCLLRIMRGLDIQPSLKSLSLQEWIDTLKEDGYDVACFIAILRQISISELGTESASSLWHYIKSVIDQPNGAHSLQDYVINHYPKLEKRINVLHASAEQEENDLEHAAGGLSAKAWGGIGLATVTLGGIAYGVSRAIKNGKTPVAGAEKALEVEMKIPSEDQIDTEAGEILSGFRDSDIKPGQLLQREGKNWLQWDDIQNHESDIKKLIRGFDFHGYAKSELSDLKSNGKWNKWKEKEAADIRAGINHDFHPDNSDKPRYEKYFSESSDEVAWANEIEKKGLNGLSWEKMLVSLKGFEEFCEQRFKSRLWAEKVVDAKGYVSNDMINALHNNNPKYVRPQPAINDQAPEIESALGNTDVTRVDHELERDSSGIAESYKSIIINRNDPKVKTFPNMRDSFDDLIRRGSWGQGEDPMDEGKELLSDVDNLDLGNVMRSASRDLSNKDISLPKVRKAPSNPDPISSIGADVTDARADLIDREFSGIDQGFKNEGIKAAKAVSRSVQRDVSSLITEEAHAEEDALDDAFSDV